MSFDELAYPFFVAAVSGAILSTVENALVDRLAYVPLALIAAMTTQPHIAGARDGVAAVTIPAGSRAA